MKKWLLFAAFFLPVPAFACILDSGCAGGFECVLGSCVEGSSSSSSSGTIVPFTGCGYTLPVGDIQCNRFADCSGTGCGFAPCVEWGYSMSVDLFYALLDGIATIITQVIILFSIGFVLIQIFFGACRWLFHLLTHKRS